MRTALPIAILLLLALSACPKSGSSSTSGEQEPVVEAPRSRFKGVTKGFVDNLTAQPALVWMVADEGGAVVYDKLFFSEDGTFRAETTVRFSGGDADTEPFDCTESGTWTLDDNEAESKTVGSINFELQSTDCAGREAPQSFRARVTINGDDITLEHR
jgi:hypothetical protein